jgi:hypothetical protein
MQSVILHEECGCYSHKSSFDTVACKNDTHDCENDTQECENDTHTSIVILTRTNVITTLATVI